MAKQNQRSSAKPSSDSKSTTTTRTGKGGETHQTTSDRRQTLTTNQGLAIADDQNSLRIGARGPTLLEDHVLREKITHFDHERIPERIVHARGSAAHGYFQPRAGASRFCKAAFLADPKKRTQVFVRFSTVAGGAGSVDLPRDVRGFATKFYTAEGNFDLVGNNIPVFFIQDAMKFPDLVHSVKMEADRGFPQNASAHDTFWDFISLMPESMHMIMWAMSDRGIPRSLRMIEGFGVHTFKMINATGKQVFVKFHWRPVDGAQSVLWDEAIKINGADQDFHCSDLWEAIDKGAFPRWELAIQVFNENVLDKFGLDVLDATKLVPEELVPLEVIGDMVLDRNPDNFFAETEQVAFHPGHVVPGIDFSDDPLLQGRLFSYIDTQLIRLGGPNFHQIPINQPKGCPFHNLQRDGHMQMQVPKGRVNYEPNSLGRDSAPKENPAVGFVTHPAPLEGKKTRERSPSFSDHYSQARQFFRSVSEPEQNHIVGALVFELGKVATLPIRQKMLGHLNVIDKDLGSRVAAGLGMQGQAEKITPARQPIDLPDSPSLSLIKKAKATLRGRKVGAMVGPGSPTKVIDAMRAALKKEGAQLDLVAERVSGVKGNDGEELPIAHAINGGPSIVFDAVALLLTEKEAAHLGELPETAQWVSDAFNHLKVIAHTPASDTLLELARVTHDAGVVALDDARAMSRFVAAAKGGRVWAREKAKV